MSGGIETMAEVHARLRTRRQVGAPSGNAREIARSALGELSDHDRAEVLTDLLCELRGSQARPALTRARNRITSHVHDLIFAEYDAEVAAMPAGDVAVMARYDFDLGEHQSLPRTLPAELRADLGAAVAAIPRPEARVSIWSQIRTAAHRLDDSWWGDGIGAVCLFATGYLLFVFAGVLS